MKQIARYRSVSSARLHFIVFEADCEAVEVFMSFFMFIVAAAFWIYGHALLATPALRLLGAIAPYQVWGVVTLAIAVSKLLSAMYDSTRWRLASVAGGCMMWCLITGSIWVGPSIGIGSLVYPAFAVVSAWLGWRIGWRAGRKERVE